MRKFPNRKSIRLKHYDYSQAGSYFITLCVQDRQHLFGEIRNGIMGLNAFGLIAHEEWQKTPAIRPNISLGAFIIMPNHMHGIIHIDRAIKNSANSAEASFRSPSQTIGAIIRGYKGAVTKRIKILLAEEGGRPEGAGKEIRSEKKGDLDRAGDLEKYGRIAIRPNDEIRPEGEIAALIGAIDFSKSIWQRNYYENIIRDYRAYQNISHYIWNNPAKWSANKSRR